MISYNELLKTEDYYLKSSCLTHHEFKLLFMHVIGKDFNPVDAEFIGEESFWALKHLLDRRAEGEPIQYILGCWPFLDIELIVDKRALIPRPETEYLAQKAVKIAECMGAAPLIIDLCSGTGAIALYIERKIKTSTVYAVELSSEACDLIKENKIRLDSDINVIESDVFVYLDSLSDNSVDLFVSNPPYVKEKDYMSNLDELKYEPSTAFLAAEEGLYFYNHMSPVCYKKLKNGGYIMYEIAEDQGEHVRDILYESGFSDVCIIKDIFGNNRYVEAKKI